MRGRLWVVSHLLLTTFERGHSQCRMQQQQTSQPVFVCVLPIYFTTRMPPLACIT